MDKYYYLEVPLGSDQDIEIELSAHESFSCLGIEEFSIDEPKVDEILGERSYSGADLPRAVIDEVDLVVNHDLRVRKFYFANEEKTLAFQNYLKKEFQLDSKLIAKEQQDWNAEWKKSYKKIEIDPTMSIIPAWEKESCEHTNTSSGNIFIYPGMGFGTGNHETTYLCLKSIQNYKEKLTANMKCLDFGCGSGILGIALNKAYQIPGDLYDIDQDALTNCEQNIELNDLDAAAFRLLLPRERGLLEDTYDIVFANILQNVLISESAYLAKSVAPGGVLILSGLLKGQDIEVIELYLKENSHLKHIQTLSKNDWIALEFVSL